MARLDTCKAPDARVGALRVRVRALLAAAGLGLGGVAAAAAWTAAARAPTPRDAFFVWAIGARLNELVVAGVAARVHRLHRFER